MAEAAEFIARISVQGLEDFLSDISRADQVFASFVGDAVEEAVKIERLTAAFGGLTHSMDMGKREMDFIRQYARTSINIFDNLADAGKRLEAGGLNMGRWLPLIDILGGIKGVGGQNLKQFADAFVRIASGGNYGMAMRQFRTIGIGLSDLKAEGIEVAGNNQIMEKDPGKILEALERIFQRKFGDMGEYLHRTMSVKFANLQDAWNHLLFRFGEQWFPLIGKMVDSVTKFVNFLGFSGEMDKLGKSFASIFESIFNMGGGQNGLEHFLSYLIATFEFLPQIIKTIGETVGKVLTFIGNGFISIMNSITATVIGVINIARSAMAAFVGAAQFFGIVGQLNKYEIGEQIKFTPISNVEDFGKKLGDAFHRMPVVGDVARRGDEIFKDFKNFKFTDVANPEGNGIFNQNHVEDTASLKDIKSNTAKIAAHMEPFKRFALGGGPIGQIGISTAERYNSQTHRVQVDVRSGNVHLDRFLGEAIEQYHQSFRRSAL